ncbi:MAG: DNA-binding protein [Gammaproteobacteria bacterium]
MGRQASINLADVKRARDELIALNKAHGIIAIRRHLGRGSPQLISKLLAEINGSSGTPAHPAPPPPGASAKALGQAWQDFSAQVENLISTSSPTSLPRAASPDSERLDALEHLVRSQQHVLDRLQTLHHHLEETLMQQQDLFDSWRHEQQAERQMLKNQFEQLSKLATASRPPRKRKKRGEQLDLYDDK